MEERMKKSSMNTAPKGRIPPTKMEKRGVIYLWYGAEQSHSNHTAITLQSHSNHIVIT